MKINALLLTVILFLVPFFTQAEVVNLNKADAATFQYYLKGIGTKKAASIVAYREENKEFQAIEEIMEVKGIGEGIFKKIKDDLSLTEGVVTVDKAEPQVEKQPEKAVDKDKASPKAKAVNSPPNVDTKEDSNTSTK